jgi:GNAT superfamily N-acetyltransferase
MIRQGTVDDIPRIIEMGRHLCDSTSYKHITMSPERVRVTCETMITHGFFIVAEKDGEVIGAMLGDVFQPWYSEDKLGIDYTFWIEPEHRNGLLAVKMMKAFETWCISMGAKQIRPGIGTGDKGAERLYSAMGYKPMGHWFLKDV